MFIGHLGVGFGAKRLAPSVSLGTLVLACELADLLWPTLVLLGIERVAIRPGDTAVTPLQFISYPYSHSLVAMAVMAALAGGIVWLVRRSRAGALTVAGVVVSHWVLDVASHRPDVPLWLSGGPKLGLGLWSSVAATATVEGLLFAGGVALYLRTTVARDRAGSVGLWAMVVFLVAIYVANLSGPPPPSVTAVAWVGEAGWLVVAWAYWIERHRVPREPA